LDIKLPTTSAARTASESEAMKALQS